MSQPADFGSRVQGMRHILTQFAHLIRDAHFLWRAVFVERSIQNQKNRHQIRVLNTIRRIDIVDWSLFWVLGRELHWLTLRNIKEMVAKRQNYSSLAAAAVQHRPANGECTELILLARIVAVPCTPSECSFQRLCDECLENILDQVAWGNRWENFFSQFACDCRIL